MADYDESDDIESPLRSDLTNATGAVVGAPTPAADQDDPAIRRRRIRFESDDLQPRAPSEEEQADEARAALLKSSIPEKPRTPMGIKARQRPVEGL